MRILALVLILATSSIAAADDGDASDGDRVCWEVPRDAGCNAYGCWSDGGGCNAYGCWSGPRGSCNAYGCSDVGACNAYGCPQGRVRARVVCGSIDDAPSEDSGCNAYGCWDGGGGCNAYGCWRSPYGECNAFGCAEVGRCNAYGCPSATRKRGLRRPRR
jgi:hypothetical protein